MADPIAEAFVLVKPILTGFVDDLRKQVNAAVTEFNKKPPSAIVKVKLDDESKKLVDNRLASITGKTVTIHVVVPTTEIEAAAAKIKTLADIADVPINVRVDPDSIAILREQIAGVAGIPVDVQPTASPADRERVAAQIGKVTADVEPVISAEDKRELSERLKGVKAAVVPTVSAEDKQSLTKRLGTLKVPVSFVLAPEARKNLVNKIGVLKASVAFRIPPESKTSLVTAVAAIKASVGVGLRIATGARDKLRAEIAEIPGATVPVTPVITGAPDLSQAARDLAQEQTQQRQQQRRRQRRDTGDTSEKKQEEQVSKSLQAQLDAEAVAKYVLAQANAVLESSTADVVELEARLAQVSAAITATNKIETEAIRLKNDALRESAVLLRNQLSLVKQPLSQRAGAQSAAAREAATKASTAFSNALDREKVVALQVAQVEQAAGSAALTYAQTKEAINAANAAVRESETLWQRALDLSTKETNEDTIALSKRTEALHLEAQASRESLIANAKRLSAVQDVARIQRRLELVPTLGAAADSDLRRLQAQEAGLVSALDAAREARLRFAAAGLHEEAEQLSLLEQQHSQLLVNTKQSREEAQESAKRQRQSAQASRGLATSLLSFAGLRAQVLAASGPFILGVAAATAFAKSIQEFSGLETTLNVFQATTGATAEQMQRAAEAARALGSDLTLPGVTARSAADAMSQLARAGLSVEQSIAATRGVLELATAANIENAQATTLVANALNAFSLSGEEASHIVDVFANAANAAQGEITDFGDAMSQTSAVANQAGVSFEDTTALLTLLARAGLRGSDAGTSLRTAFLRLVAPSQEARNILDSLGVQIRNLEGDIRPEIFADFARATADLSPNLRDAFASAVFGQDAIRAALLAGRQGVQGLRDVQSDLQRVGTGAELAAARTAGLAGAFQNIANQAAVTGSSIGELFAPAAQRAAEGFATAVAAVGTGVELITPAVTAAAGAAASLVSAVGGVGPILAAITAYKSYSIAVNIAAAAQARFSATAILTARLGAAAGAAAALAAATGGLGGKLRVAGALLASFAGSANGVAIALAATAAAVAFLLTRESELERSTKALASSLLATSTSLQNYRAAVEALNTTQASLPTQKLAVDTANLAVAQAQANLAASTASETSIERKSLELALAQAIDQQRLAQEAYNKALEQIPAQETAVAQARRDHQRDIEEQRASIDRLRESVLESARSATGAEFGIRPAPGVIEGVNQQVTEARAAAVAVDQFAESLRNLATDQTDLDPILRRNIELLAAFVERVRREPTTREISFILNNDDFKRSTDDLVRIFGLAITDARAAAATGGAEVGKTFIQGSFKELAKAQELGKQLVANLVQLESLGGPEAEGQLADQVRAEVERMITELEAFGPAGAFVLKQARAQLVPALADSLRAGIAEFANVDEILKQEVPDTILTQIQRLSAQGPKGKAELRKLGKELTEAFAQGVDEGNDQITEAVESAKANLASLGESLSSQVSQLIDAGPLGQQIERLEAQLAARQTRQQRLGLVDQLREAQQAVKEAAIEVSPLARQLKQLEDQLERIRSIGEKTDLSRALRDAREALERARASIAGTATTQVEVGARARFLRPLEEGVESAERTVKEAALERKIGSIGDRLEAQKQALQGDPFVTLTERVNAAEQALKDFDSEQIIAGLRKAAEEQKKTVTNGINNVIAQFNTGGISLAQAQSRIAKLVGSKVKPWQDAGFALGRAFGVKFRETAFAVLSQMEEIAVGPRRPGTTGVTPRVSSPAQQASELIRQIGEQEAARKKVRDAIDSGINGAGGMKQSLQSIDRKLSGRVVKITTSTARATDPARGGE